MPAIFPLHMDRDHACAEGTNSRTWKISPKNRANTIRTEIEDRRKRLPIQEQPKRRSSAARM